MQETIVYRFNNFKCENLGAIPTFSRAIRGMQYGKQKIVDAFNKLIPKDEYAKNEKEEILNDLMVKNFDNETLPKALKNKDSKKVHCDLRHLNGKEDK